MAFACYRNELRTHLKYDKRNYRRNQRFTIVIVDRCSNVSQRISVHCILVLFYSYIWAVVVLAANSQHNIPWINTKHRRRNPVTVLIGFTAHNLKNRQSTFQQHNRNQFLSAFFKDSAQSIPRHTLYNSDHPHHDENERDSVLQSSFFVSTQDDTMKGNALESAISEHVFDPVVEAKTYVAPKKQVPANSLTKQQIEIFQAIIQNQQRQIDTLLNLLQQQTLRAPDYTNDISHSESFEIANGDVLKSTSLLSPFQPLSSQVSSLLNSTNTTIRPQQINRVHNKKILKAMLFIDGTWLYYSIHERLAKDCSIIQKYGRGWQHRYEIDWSKLPSIISSTLQNEIMDQLKSIDTHSRHSANNNIFVHLVQSSVYTSYKADTATTSHRYKLFQSLQRANYHVHMMETVGKSEKCVDIQLAVEMLHYATLHNPTESFDIALLLTGDKDLMPALIRTKCKGKQVGLISMRPGCNRALIDTPGLLDYNVIWVEDYLDQLVVPRKFDDELQNLDGSKMTSEAIVHTPPFMYTLHKVVFDFIHLSGLSYVSSRDLGRYLKQCNISTLPGNTLLEIMKRYYGGMYQYLTSMGCYNCEIPTFTPNSTDHSYWISLVKQTDLISDDEERIDITDSKNFIFEEPSQIRHLSKTEITFFESYNVTRLVHDRHSLYAHSIERMSDSTTVKSADRTINDQAFNARQNISNYETMNVIKLKAVCREYGLPVSGTKAILLDRIQTLIEIEKANSNVNKSRGDTSMTNNQHAKVRDDANVVVYLKYLIQEYLHANGGAASSRMIGRYLAVNKPSSPTRENMKNALQELKAIYGNLNTFISTYSDTFRFDRTGASSDENGFTVALK